MGFIGTRNLLWRFSGWPAPVILRSPNRRPRHSEAGLLAEESAFAYQSLVLKKRTKQIPREARNDGTGSLV